MSLPRHSRKSIRRGRCASSQACRRSDPEGPGAQDGAVAWTGPDLAAGRAKMARRAPIVLGIWMPPFRVAYVGARRVRRLSGYLDRFAGRSRRWSACERRGRDLQVVGNDCRRDVRGTRSVQSELEENGYYDLRIIGGREEGT